MFDPTIHIFPTRYLSQYAPQPLWRKLLFLKPLPIAVQIGNRIYCHPGNVPEFAWQISKAGAPYRVHWENAKNPAKLPPNVIPLNPEKS